jgi:lipopolysaccharide cholinephosphotransferase
MTNLKSHQAILLELVVEFDRVCRENGIKYALFAGSALGAVRHRGFIPWDDDLDVVVERSDYEKLIKIAPEAFGDKYYFQVELSEHWPLPFSKLRKNGTTCLEKYHPKDKEIHQGIYIDVFPVDNASDNRFLRRVQFYASKVVLAKALDKRGYETDSKLKKIFMAVCRLLPMKPFVKITQLRSAGQSRMVHSFLGGTSRYQKGLYKRKWISETVLMDFEGRKFPGSAHYDELLSALYGDYMEIPDESQREIKKHALFVDTEKNYTEYENYRDGMKFDVYTRSIR